ncbi:MAG: GumC family protein [Mariniblastus sp.]
MNEAFLQNLTFASVASSIWRQKIKAIVFAMLMIAIVAVVLMMLPRKYESVGKLFVQVGRGDVTLDPSGGASKTIMVQESRESEINTVMDVIQSRGVLELVAQRENIENEILESKSLLSKLPIPSLSMFGSGASESTYEGLLKRDKAIMALQSSIGVRNPRKAATLTINCRSESAELSQKIVRVLMEVYIEEHVKARQTDGSFDFFEKEFALQKKNVDSISDKIESYKNEIGVMSIEGKQAALREKIAEIESALLKASAEKVGFEFQVKELEKMVVGVPKEVELESTEGMANQASDLMTDRLFSLEIQEKDLRSRLRDDHPSVLAVRRQVEQAKELLTNQKSDRKQVKRGLNKNRQTLDLALMQAKVNLRAAAAQVESLTNSRDTAIGRMNRLNSFETQMASLYRDLTVSEENFKIYSEKREEARINLALDKQNLSNVKLVQPATIQVKHVSPKYSLILLASLFFALAGAFCVAIFAEQMDTSLKSDQQIESVLGVDVLATIPNVSRRNLFVG